MNTMTSIFSTFTVVILCFACRDVSAKKVIFMENFIPEKAEGTWYVVRRNIKLFADSVKCIKYNLKHDPKLEDVYAMTTYWVNAEGKYIETHFNVVDDRTKKSRFFFESQKDKVAVSVLGTDYMSYSVGFGVNGDRETYYVSSRAKKFPTESSSAVEDILKLNEVERDWVDVEQTDCPDEH